MVTWLTWFYAVGDGVVRANGEHGETSELPEGPRESVLHDVGAGGVPLQEADILHVCLSTQWHGGIDKDHVELKFSPAAKRPLHGFG